MAKPPTAGQHKRQRFVEQYLIHGNASLAAIEAGYAKSGAGTEGYRLLRKPAVIAALERGRRKLAAKAEITAERVLAEFAKVGFANMADYLTFTTGGDPIVDLRKLEPDKAAAVAEVTVDDQIDGRGDDARTVRRVRLKLHDKLGALNSIGRHLGMFTDRQELSGPNGGPIETNSLSDNELARRLAFILASAAAKPKGG